jgi:homospermidine synthase
VSSVALVELCQEKGALYLDTCIEPWPGGYTDPSLPPAARSNYALRESALALRPRYLGGPTAVITHGANPGLVSHFVKQALIDLARTSGLSGSIPQGRDGWALLAAELGLKVIHIAERDTQVATIPKEPGEFVNTWSIDGFVSEGSQPAELGWGTHERHFPEDGRRHDFGCDAAIYLLRPGAATRVRSWTPLEGPYHGFLITHGESISIADYLTVRDGDRVRSRPTCHYAYHPCDDAVLSLHEFAGKNWRLQNRKRLMMEEITSGIDELGVLLMGPPKGVYWYGSRLTIEEARRVAPHNNATSLQVTAAVLAGVVWALEHPNEGIIEPEEMDFARVLDVARPYLGEMVGVHGDWTPLDGRERLFPEDLDREDPWQFKNIRVR